MDLNTAYRDQLLALLPKGAAWARDMEAALPDFLHAFGDEFARFHLRLLALLDERSPMLAFEMLAEWEADFGLPDTCGLEVTDTAARRAAVVARVTALGGQTVAYYLQVLAAYGVTATITEFIPHSVDEDVSAALFGEDWIFAFQVNLPAGAAREFTVSDGVDDPLAVWGSPPVECLIQNIKPAHTIALFTYQ